MKILIIVAHADDEVLGAGGTLIKHKEKGDELYCLVLGDGVTSRNDSNEIDIKIRQDEMKKASEILGLKKTFYESFPDNSFDSISILKIIKKIEKTIEITTPDIIYTHSEHDVNIDHVITFNAVMTACRPCNKNMPQKIYSFEILSSTEWQMKKIFSPNVFNNVSKTIELKKKALEAYQSEIRYYPHPRSIEGIEILAKYRGLQSGLKFAEAFELKKEINN